MKIEQIYSILDDIAPFCDQEKWDNSGLQIGSMKSEFDEIYLSLDIDSNMIDELSENSLLITHHPLIFGGLKSINTALYPSNIIKKMLTKNISLISMHTNFDKYVLNKFVATEILGYKINKIEDFVIFLDINSSFDELLEDVAKKLNLKNVKFVKANQNVSKVGFCTGSGSELIKDIYVDCFITGDIKYHTALECYENSISLIDIGHYESERYFGYCLKELLQKKQIKSIIKNSINPFNYYEGKL
ncbi:metal-binding protein [Campylobacter sputorum subsp. bubulus]|uniref:GTP cyclohydrolase 1 type 2 homolog n=1 Tax=Campylobacter sputorum subsp. sputorum TaxID=32024 RepID=A0A381DI86_9BACT|nr:Nif3-like dinuclear metal center hexameric protein [Campylobacter sputorum]ASM35431.1 NIF3 domain protein [Campylobacter sputorum aubsp. sputorum RM3237]ASM37127.1 NIF3 domain protein [Campylobacter sputorum bv. faecalis CCUG 20703]ASM38798.1 NIF3 domain protein [Campylobacter sputorum bv. paraureolyticus LMG 11764]KAB0582828.1 Nif3-like dinuclear metal center hexameric protein [Campylobacter sputorum subsp. sputorum]MDY6120550.1 Nif3-like dinuclear metal center hexameric protein [Campyloba